MSEEIHCGVQKSVQKIGVLPRVNGWPSIEKCHFFRMKQWWNTKVLLENVLNFLKFHEIFHQGSGPAHKAEKNPGFFSRTCICFARKLAPTVTWFEYNRKFLAYSEDESLRELPKKIGGFILGCNRRIRENTKRVHQEQLQLYTKPSVSSIAR